MNQMFSCLVLIILSILSLASSLQVGFYGYTCPSAEEIVRSTVNKAVSLNPGIGAGLIRMHFHDCFVRGCDASVLLVSTPGNIAERDNFINNPSLRGFDVINEAKAQLESACPQTVSCADILTFATRDSVVKLSGGTINYDVPSGRRDGRISIADEVPKNLPGPSFNADQLIANFKQKGLSADEMVTLSGAHSIGASHCSSFSNRLYSFSGANSQDPSLDPSYVESLKTQCPPPPSSNDPLVVLDVTTPNRLDNVYYQGLINHHGLFTSDQTLLSSQSTQESVLSNANYGSNWVNKFAQAMVHMGSIDVLSGYDGEIRKHCSFVN